MSLQDIKSKTKEELQEWLKEWGQPAYRGGQVFRWLHQVGVESFEEMTDLPRELRQGLAERCYIASAQVSRRQVSRLDGTVKYLFRLFDGEHVECVLMEYHHGVSICISTQVGCKMGCTFCATGKSGFSRNLTASEMLAQVQAAQKDSGKRVSNIVLMGMGEPLDNYDQVLRFLRLVSCGEGLNIGMRHISLSTCGLVDKIYQLEKERLQLTLSVSLHAPNDEIRSRTMPVNQKWNVEQLLAACRSYAGATGRRISFEYAMIRGVNDSDACARELAGRLEGMLCHVNLIPVNDVTGNQYRKSTVERQKRFVSILERKGIPATVRRTLGSDIDASCGQLRRRAEEGEAIHAVVRQK
ncbi:MAG TPA: 23S rRNA (adenine(2503)-C(2))-methyltransferase RlmN [Candidatus Caccousia avistercoris]|nr:23S rRNA (adenine(2503)-C(2))-methyltransferase RlmN [Candidatus Caccousia avistercoris]